MHSQNNSQAQGPSLEHDEGNSSDGTNNEQNEESDDNVVKNNCYTSIFLIVTHDIQKISY